MKKLLNLVLLAGLFLGLEAMENKGVVQCEGPVAYDYASKDINGWKQQSSFENRIFIVDSGVDSENYLPVIGAYNTYNLDLANEYNFNRNGSYDGQTITFFSGQLFSETVEESWWFFGKKYIKKDSMEVAAYSEIPYGRVEKDNVFRAVLKKNCLNDSGTLKKTFFAQPKLVGTGCYWKRVIGAMIAVAVGAGAYKIVWPAINVWRSGK